MNGSNSNTSAATVGTLAFTGKPQCVSQAARDELQRDAIITIPASSGEADIWPGTQPPDDKTLIWWAKDPTSGVRIGKPKTWDASTNQWVELGQPQVVKLPERRFGNDSVAAAASQSKEIEITPAMPIDDFFFAITITTQIGTTYNAASANMDDFGYQVIGKAKDKVTVEFFGVPTGGLGFDWKAEEK